MTSFSSGPHLLGPDDRHPAFHLYVIDRTCIYRNHIIDLNNYPWVSLNSICIVVTANNLMKQAYISKAHHFFKTKRIVI